MSDVFEPHPRLRNGHVMTVWAWGRQRTFPRLPLPQDRVFIVAPDARVLGRCYWQPTPTSHPTLIALHGLEGSSDAHYMRGMADKAFARRLQRRPAEPAQLRRHRAPVADAVPLGAVGRRRRRAARAHRAEGHRAVVIAGYSLGGNLALKLAGDYGRDAPTTLKAVAAVSPVMDLPRCVDALERRSNFFYQWNFVRNLKARMRRKAAAFPGRFSIDALDRIRTVRRVRRGIHGAVLRLPRCDRLLLPRGGAARGRAHRGADAGHRRRRQSVRAGRLVPPVRGHAAIRTSRCA